MSKLFFLLFVHVLTEEIVRHVLEVRKRRRGKASVRFLPELGG